MPTANHPAPALGRHLVPCRTPLQARMQPHAAAKLQMKSYFLAALQVHCRRGLSALLGLSLMLAGVCAQAAQLPVTVSIPPQKYMVESIGGDLVNVTVMVPPGADPHTYEPRPSQLRALASSPLYFAIGVPFEDVWLDRMASAGGKGLTIVHMEKGLAQLPATALAGDDTASTGVANVAAGNTAQHAVMPESSNVPQQITEQEKASGSPYPHHDDAGTAAATAAAGHDHEGADPHIWLSPMHVKHMGIAIRNALVKADPANAPIYRKNYRAFAEKLDALDLRLNERLSQIPVEKRRFLVFHPAWNYFAHSYGLEEVPIEVEGREPGPRQLMNIIDLARKERISVIFVQPQFSRRAAEAIAKQIGATLVDADPLAENWAENLEKVAESIVASTKK